MNVKESDYLIPFEAAGLQFRNNFVVGSGPAVKTIEMIKQIERWGWGAASLKLAVDPAYISKPPRYRWLKKNRYHAFTAETRLTLYRGSARVDEEKCTGCGICADIGHCCAITMKKERARVNPDDCTGCSTCVDVCPAGAIGMVQFERIG